MVYNGNTAWNIYCRANEMSAKKYVDELRRAVYSEVQMTGVCRLIEELIVNPLNSGRFRLGGFDIPLLSYLAIEQALDALENGGGFPELGNGVQTEEGAYTWNYLNSFGANQHTYKLTLDQMRQLNNRYSQLGAGLRKAPSMEVGYYGPAAGSDKKAEKALEKARKEADRILENAKAEAAKIKQSATQAAERCSREANESANRIIEHAQNQAANAYSKAKTEAQWTIADARRDADQIRQTAQNEAARIKRIAEDDAEGIRKAARQQAEEEAERNVATLIQQKLSGHIQELRRQWEEDQKENSQQRVETSTLAAALKEDACTVSTTIGAKLNRDLEQLQEQINQLRSNVTLDLQQWRASLYKCEYGKIVNFYNTLNGYANSFERELREAECKEHVSEELKKVLGEHSRKLNRLRSNLVGAMEPMGLRLFTPEKGETFNSYYHATNEDEDDDVFLDQEIVQCLKPGIERVVNDREVAVLLRASVEVRKDGME